MQLAKALQVLRREFRIDINYLLCRTSPKDRAVAVSDDDVRRILSGARRIGVLRLDRIGDFVLFTPALAAIRRAWPDARVTLVGSPVWRDLAEWLSREKVVAGAPLFDEFLSVDPERLVERDHFRDAARCLADFDVTFSPVVSRSNGADKLIGASAAPAFGTTGENSNILPWDKRTNDRFYARLVAADPKSHETENHAAFLEHLGIDVGPAVGMPRWRVPREAKALVLDGLRQRLGLELGECFIAVSPFSKMRLKEWPEASWHAVLDALAAKLPDMSIFLLGTELDREAHGGFVRALAARPEVVDLTGKTSLVETTVLLSEATLAVSVDTAAPHIASAVGTPSIVILGGGHYGRFFPYDSPWPEGRNVCLTHRMDCYHCGWRCRYQPVSRPAPPCIAHITPESVVAAVLEIAWHKRNATPQA